MSSFQEKFNDLYNTSQYDKALELVTETEKAGQLPSGFAGVKTFLLGRLGRIDEAINEANIALAVNKNNYELYSMKGVSLYRLGRYAESIDAFNSCLEIRPNYPIAVQQKISALAMLGEYVEAVKSYEESDIPEVNQSWWYGTLSHIYLGINNCALSKSFLNRALRINAFESMLHYNVSFLHKRLKHPVRHLLHYGIYLILSILEKIDIWKQVVGKIEHPYPHITESSIFTGPGTLFSHPSQKREIKTIIKLLHGYNAMALCNDTWNWFAVNIQYNAVEKNGYVGDIDILLKRPRYFGEHDAGFTYRGFEVKTTSVNKYGRMSSVKRGRSKLREIKKQLDLLKKFGCEQIFLLEIFVLERGYSTRHNFPSPEIQKEILEKKKFFEKLGYGYVVMADEPTTTCDDVSGGVVHMPINILKANNNQIGPNFQKLVDGIDSFLASPAAQEIAAPTRGSYGFGFFHICYCMKCKQLTMLVPKRGSSHFCGRCGDFFC